MNTSSSGSIEGKLLGMGKMFRTQPLAVVEEITFEKSCFNYCSAKSSRFSGCALRQFLVASVKKAKPQFKDCNIVKNSKKFQKLNFC